MQAFKCDCRVIVDVADLASSNNKGVIHVLHVDDDPSIREISKQILTDMGSFDFDGACCVDEAFGKLKTGIYDVVVSDYEMPMKNGLQFLKELREKKNDVPFILFTGKGREEVAIQALNWGADRYINKNGPPETVYTELAYAIVSSVEKTNAKRQMFYDAMLFQNVTEPIVATDDKRVIKAWNKAAEKLFGWTAKEVTGKSVQEVFDSVQVEPPEKMLIEELDSRGVFHGEIVRKNKAGVPVAIELNIISLQDRLGKFIGNVAVYHDISQRKKTEEAIKKQAALIDLSPDAIIVKNMDETITFWNTGAEKLYGYTKQEALGQKINILLKAKHSKSFDDVITQLKQGKNWTGEITDYNKNNNEVIVQSYWSATLDAQGDIVEILESNVDITERKKEEEAIKFQANLLNHIGQAVIMVDNNRIIRFWNKAAEKLYGWPEEQALGHKVTELLGDTSPEEADEVTKRLLAGESWSTEVLAKNRDGSVVPVILNQTPLFNEDREFVGSASITTDISLQKNTEADLTFSLISLSDSLDKIQELNEKLRVVGGLTRHDVCNKLSAVTGYAYILKKKHSDQAGIVDGLGKMEQAVQEIVRIFDFAKMYEQLGAEELTYINVEEKLKEAVALFSGPIPTIINECHGLTVLADSFLRQLFFNFIDNTRKYGKKTTTIRVYFERADQDSLKLVYEDDGVGVPFENKPRLFKEGYSTGGSTGFGLFLTKKMMDVYGWQIQENGTPGEEARFTITIPKLSKSGKENYQIAQ